MIYCILKRPFHNSIIICIEEGKRADILKELYNPYLVFNSRIESNGQPDLIINNNGIYVLKANQQYDFTPYKDFDSQLLQIERAIEKLTVISNQIITFHGAAVEHNNNCTLLLAPSHRGKSTLVSFLVTNENCGFVTDDIILVDKESLVVYPFAVPIKLRKGGLDVLKKCDSSFSQNARIMNHQSVILFSPYKRITNNLKIDRIFWTCYDNSSTNQVQKVPLTDRILSLISSTTKDYFFTKNFWDSIKKLAYVDSYFIEYSDLFFARKIILGS